MSAYLMPIICYILLCCIVIGVLALYDRMSRALSSWLFAILTLGVVGALVALAYFRDDLSHNGIYVTYGSVVIVWMWLEASIHTTYGSGVRRFGFARESALWQELMWIIPALGIAGLTWSGVNQFGLWAFGLFWCSHLSSRIAAYAIAHARADGPLVWPPWFAVGLPPAQLLSAVFPLVITLMTAVCTLLVYDASRAGFQTADGVGRLLLATQAGLACMALWWDVLPIGARFSQALLVLRRLNLRRAPQLNAPSLRDSVQG